MLWNFVTFTCLAFELFLLHTLFCAFLVLHFGMHHYECIVLTAKHSSEWMIQSHSNYFIQGEVNGFQVLLDSLNPCSTSASHWSPRVLQGVHSIYGANDASCTSAGTTSCPTMKFCVVMACSTSHTSSVSEDWVSLVTSPDFEVMY